MNPWHDVPLGPGVGEAFPAVIETPRESRVQYEIDLSTGLLRVKRVLFSAMHYPANYGFVPQTLGEDGEPLDVLVLGQEAIHPMSVVRARAIGVLRMVQAGKRDDKVLAVHLDDPVFSPFRSWQELPRYQLVELETFFNDYRAIEGVETSTAGFAGASEAAAVVRELAAAYVAHVRHGPASG